MINLASLEILGSTLGPLKEFGRGGQDGSSHKSGYSVAGMICVVFDASAGCLTQVVSASSVSLNCVLACPGVHLRVT